MLTASRERGVIGGREIDAQHPEDRCQDALGLTQRSVEEETERQGGFDGEIGILELPAPPADASRCPRGDRVGREPEGDVASPHEGSVVLGPVPDAIRCRVLRMHSRLHIEIMTRRRSRWSTCRPLLAHRAESAHQRRTDPRPPLDHRRRVQGLRCAQAGHGAAGDAAPRTWRRACFLWRRRDVWWIVMVESARQSVRLGRRCASGQVLSGSLTIFGEPQSGTLCAPEYPSRWRCNCQSDSHDARVGWLLPPRLRRSGDVSRERGSLRAAAQ